MRRLTSFFGLAILVAVLGRGAEAQIPQPVVRPSAPLVVASDPASQIAALQQQVAALQAAVQALQAKTQFVTWDGSTYVINVPGNIRVLAAGNAANIEIAAMTGVQIKAGSSLAMQASAASSLMSGGTTTVSSGGTTSILGTMVQINRNGAPAATVGSTTTPAIQGAAGKVATGSNTVLIGN